ncbi:MAG: NAD(P)/FAD-dependent oxidoreductase [Candidatus Nitrosocosmicus sp.]|nr:NAD(P)/FAD-dependent oxidoreductase [Candidatus Nitrosocosmicus sp.]
MSNVPSEQRSDIQTSSSQSSTPSSLSTTNSKHIVILGGGFAGIGVLKNLQKEFHNYGNIEITLIDQDNFFLFTPMLPEVASGMIETRHIVTPVRSFCKKAKFYEAKIQDIDLKNNKIDISHKIGRQHDHDNSLEDCNDNDDPDQNSGGDSHKHTIPYDHLVIALGNENNFFGNTDIELNSFTLKSITDAIKLRNHLIKILEQVNLEQDNKDLRKSLLTFVVVGGGFSGVEAVGSINDFIRDSVKRYYKNILMSEIRVILVSATDKILEQIDEDLGNFALSKLQAKGVDFIFNKKVKEVTQENATLDDGTIIPTYSLIWTAGVSPSKLVANLECEHDKSHRILTNEYLEVKDYEGVVYALGDCASTPNPNTGKPYPPTAQHAIKQSEIVSKNIVLSIKRREKENQSKKKRKINYKTRGMMAQIGKRNGVAILFGKIRLHGFLAWWLWRTYYLTNLPTANKKLKVVGDWTFDLLFKPDVSQIH